MLEPGEIRICRACMRQITDGNYTEIQQNSLKNDLYKLIFCYIPEFEIEVENPCLCYECFSTLYLFHKFKRRCVRTEEDLRLYVRERPEVALVDLSDVLTQNGGDIEVVPPTDVKYEALPTQVAVLARTDIPGDNWLCSLCGGVSFSSTLELTDHLAEVHKKDEETTCLVCHLKLANKFDLEQHRCTALENSDTCKSKTESVKKCAVCKNCFADNESKLRVRLQEIHRINSGTVCLLCMRELKGSKTMGMHVLQNKGDLSYKCHICEKNFTDLKTFTYHMRMLHPDTTALGKRKCPHCTKILLDNQYEKHIRFHNQPNIRKFTCSVCKWVYFSSGGLDFHIRSAHKDFSNIGTDPIV